MSHLGIARELKDTAGEACALLNLGNCLSSRSEFAEAIPYYEQYLMLSQELADVEGEAKACHFLGTTSILLREMHHFETFSNCRLRPLLYWELQGSSKVLRSRFGLGEGFTR